MQPNELHASAVLYARLRNEIAEAYGLHDEDEALADTLEGATDLQEIIVRAAREARQAKAMAEAIVSIVKDNEARRERYLEKAERIREAIARAMQEAGLPKITAPDMTLSMSVRKPAPKVVDADALPEWAKIEKTVFTPDRDAIKQAYEEDPQGFSCPGVIITNAEPILTARWK